MPNWCSTTIHIYNNNLEELRNFSNLLKIWTSKNAIKNGYGLNWLGNIVINSGIGTVDTNIKTDISCRGELSYFDLNEKANELNIDVETAWVPMLKMWRLLLDKYLPNAEMLYSAEEPGCGIQCTNDYDLVEKYVIDNWDYSQDIVDYESEATETVVKEILQKILKTEEKDVMKLIDMFKKSDIDGIRIKQWEFREESDWY